jgi:hypothetical protein
MGVAFFVKEDSLKRIEPGMQSNESEVGASTQLTRMDALRNSTKVEKVLALDRRSISSENVCYRELITQFRTDRQRLDGAEPMTLAVTL